MLYMHYSTISFHPALDTTSTFSLYTLRRLPVPIPSYQSENSKHVHHQDSSSYDRLKELKQFDDSKIGVKGLLDVEPVPGALLVNIGDILQIMSNDEYESVEHRVLANPFHEPRITVGAFFNPGNRENLYGPLSEIISPEKLPVYQQFQLADFLKRFLTKELDGKTLTNYYRL